MSKYNTGGAEVKESTYVSAYLEPATVVVGSIEKAEFFLSSQKQTPGIKLHFFETEPTEGLTNTYSPVKELENHRVCTTQFWLTDGAMDPSKMSSITKFLKILVQNVQGEEKVAEWEAKAGEATSDEDYAQIITDWFGGVEFAGLIAGETYTQVKDGKEVEKMKSFLNYGGSFARPVANADYLQAIVDAGKVSLIKDGTVKTNTGENLTPSNEDNLLD